MLDTQTKRRIDDCRDILVGKLPDPKAQIEQITIGLIYKFMDDMDKEAIELGGIAKFFSADYEKYGWDKLFDTKVTATQMLGLYSGAIESMEKNPNIPQLFRDIFKNAYLPYRDPETLKMFLKTIGKFEYTHSEKLGDAFEYLLSIMGSQGDAGQFRTPRHIIDFLVAVVDPDIGETILDPACGTAGFLISAYKHILLKHTKGNKEGLNIYTYNNLENKEFNNLGDKLTPDHRKRLIQDIAGYDISPDMVRLSLVNLYLHGFPDPEINEYDTLSSEERWKEDYDVVLANPPFMSPKGGIRPHKRFTIASNRSEVLFVDYIAEHLTPKGKAGIIVPEGVIFQGGKAYKDLRKMLVENHLYAVVSLPAGVFNPYSGVKTSILLMDRTVATKRNDILFVKIDNDGYNLGAQRAAVKGGQLDEAIAIIKAFRNADPSRHAEQGRHAELVSASLTTTASPSVNQTLKRVQGDGDGDVQGDGEPRRHAELVSASPNTISHAVLKSEIAANGDYNLNGERYKSSLAVDSNFEMVELSNDDIFKVVSGGTPSSKIDEYWNGNINWATLVDLPQGDFITTINSTVRKISDEGLKNSSAKILPFNSILVSTRATIGRIAINAVECCTNQGFKNIIINDFKKANTFYVALMMTKLIDRMVAMATGGTFKELSMSSFKTLQIPLPPLSIQEEIVEEIESYQKIIDSAKAIVENYKPRIDIDSDWEMVELGEICDITSSKRIFKNEYVAEGVPFYRTKEIVELSKRMNPSLELFISDERYKEIKAKNDIPKEGDILVSAVGTLGVSWIVNHSNPFYFKDGNLVWIKSISNIIKSIYLKLILDVFIPNQIHNLSAGAAYKAITIVKLKELQIPLPNIGTQDKIVSQIEKEQELVNANKQLIEIFEQKIKDRIAKVWGEDKEQEVLLTIAAEPEGGYVKGC